MFNVGEKHEIWLSCSAQPTEQFWIWGQNYFPRWPPFSKWPPALPEIHDTCIKMAKVWSINLWIMIKSTQNIAGNIGTYCYDIFYSTWLPKSKWPPDSKWLPNKNDLLQVMLSFVCKCYQFNQIYTTKMCFSSYKLLSRKYLIQIQNSCHL